MYVLEAIESRRSVGRVTDAVPPRELIERLLAAAVVAPNHHETEPWRFFVLTGAAKEAFGRACGEALRLRQPGDPNLDVLAEGELIKTRRAPVLLVVGARLGADPMERAEDIQATAAAIENLLLAAHSLGVAAQWRTGAGAYDDHVKAHLGLAPTDAIAGIVYLGYADPERPVQRERSRGYADKTEWRGWE